MGPTACLMGCAQFRLITRSLSGIADVLVTRIPATNQLNELEVKSANQPMQDAQTEVRC